MKQNKTKKHLFTTKKVIQFYKWVYNKGKQEVLKQVEEIIDYLNEKFRKENIYVRCEGDEFNDVWAEELKQKLKKIK